MFYLFFKDQSHQMTAHQSVNRVTEAAKVTTTNTTTMQGGPPQNTTAAATNPTLPISSLTPPMPRKFLNPTPVHTSVNSIGQSPAIQTTTTTPTSANNSNSSTATTPTPKKQRIFINIFNPELASKKKEADPLIAKPFLLSASSRLAYLKSPRMMAARQSRLQFSRPPIPSSRLHTPQPEYFASRHPKPTPKSDQMLFSGSEINKSKQTALFYLLT